LNNKGTCLSCLGRFDESIICFDQILINNPKSISAWNNKGWALRNLGQCEEAFICFDKVLAIDGKDKTAWGNKGTALYHLKQYPESVMCFDQGLAIEKSSYFWTNKGVANLLQHDLEAVSMCLTASAECNPSGIYHKFLTELYHFASHNSCHLFAVIDDHIKQNIGFSQTISSQLELYVVSAKFFMEYNAFPEAEICLRRALILPFQSTNPLLKALQYDLEVSKANSPDKSSITIPESNSPQTPIILPYSQSIAWDNITIGNLREYETFLK